MKSPEEPPEDPPEDPPADQQPRPARILLVADDGQPPPVPVTEDPAVARRTGALLICRDLSEAAGLIEAGWRVMVDADAAGSPQAAAAAAALCAWLGAAAVRTRHVTEVRRAIDMAESIRGTRPLPGGGYGRSG
ncbi:MAG TPA: hypothetical protein VGL63_07485 [Streptosporangiaceae bacterium]